jgi:uncharacterized protein YciI
VTGAPENGRGRLFLVDRPHGTEWIAGRGPREQPLWDEHARFMDAVFDAGVIVLAGPLADGSGAVLVMEATDEREVRRLLARDPWIVDADILGVGEVREWDIFLDGRRGVTST